MKAKFLCAQYGRKHKLLKSVLIRMTRLHWNIQKFRRIIIKRAMKYYIQ